ncbi:MAG TPA: VWA domain-containing protein [Steroidobacteraceae bacterium]|nr:VWA domain-containing protein [Steroidobacteraceae bacterium]
MIHFAWPWMALLAILPLLHYRARSTAEPRAFALYLPFSAALSLPGSAHTLAPRSARLLLIAAWLLLSAAAMRPQWLSDPQPVPTSGRRMLLAVDVSGSMAIEDMAGGKSRLQVVQQVAGRFIDGRQGDRVGLILFGTQPYLQAPLTADLVTVHRFLDDAVVGVAGTETAIGDAIGLAIKRLRAEAQDGRASERAQRTLLVLLTDGQNDAGVMPPLDAAHVAAQTGLRIYTIGVGASADDALGAPGNSDLDEDTLRAIAGLTGGEYFRATDAGALQAVYDRIDRLEPAEGHQQWVRPIAEWFSWPLALALLLSVPAACVLGRQWA